MQKSVWWLIGAQCAALPGAFALRAVGAQSPAVAAPSGALAPTSATSIAAPGAEIGSWPGDSNSQRGLLDSRGNIFFTDQPTDRILEWSVDGKLSTYMQPCGRSNGLCFDRQGSLWACADAKNELWRIDPNRKVTVVVKSYQGRLLNGPNDVWVRPDGGIYLTDPYYQRPYWHRGPKEYTGEYVFFLSPDHKTLRPVAEDLVRPNGIIGTPDGKTLYVSDIDGKKTYRYRVQPDGSLTDRALFCEMGSDGMTIDSEGNVYLTGIGVTIFNHSGRQIGQIPIQEAWTGNICFGGADRRTLFITASTGIYALRTRTHGVGSQ